LSFKGSPSWCKILVWAKKPGLGRSRGSPGVEQGKDCSQPRRFWYEQNRARERHWTRLLLAMWWIPHASIQGGAGAVTLFCAAKPAADNVPRPRGSYATGRGFVAGSRYMHASDAASTLTARATGGLPPRCKSGAKPGAGHFFSRQVPTCTSRCPSYVVPAQVKSTQVCRRSGPLLPSHSHPPLPAFCPPSPGHTPSPHDHDNHSFAIATANAHIPFKHHAQYGLAASIAPDSKAAGYKLS